MNKLVILLSFLLVSFTRDTTTSTHVSNEFVPEIYSEVPLSNVKPTGWLLNQLKIMRNGSTGHLDEMHSKIGHDNGWLGGNGDGWEETPYWLDGAVPLAYLLNDESLKKKVLTYINWTIDHQRPSGYFGPVTKTELAGGNPPDENTCETGEDWWPKMVMLKVIQQYYSATDDSRVIPFMTRYFSYQKNVLQKCPIGKWTEWSKSRGADNVMMVQWLYSKTKDPSLLELASLIESQSFPWSEWLGNRDWVMGAAAQQNHDHWMHRHAVNVGMALKSPAVNYQRTKDAKYLTALKTGWDDLMLLHGLPMGIFSGDEDLHGNDPTQGVELCAIVESMFSMEKIVSITGDVQYMDALERMTFNALPTQTTDDYNMKQYFQIANQVQVSRGVFDFSLPFDREMNNVFGLKSGYTCCTSNMHQGWTKYTHHLWYTTQDNGLAALEYGPNQLTTKINGQDITIKEETTYPFSDVIVFTVTSKKAVKFPFQLRIPSWCIEATISINGTVQSTEMGGKIVTLNRSWKDGDKLTLKFPMTLTTSNWGRNSRAVERGPLVYALRLGTKWEKGNEPNEGDYYSIYPLDEWNYGLAERMIKDPVQNAKIITRPVDDSFVWNVSHAPIEISVPARKIPAWKAVNCVAYQPVTDRDGLYKGKVSDVNEMITLIPYGCTKVRVVAFPVVK